MNLNTLQQISRDRVNATLSRTIKALPEHSERLKQAMEYALLTGGKRMRPFLVYAIGRMLLVQEKDLDGPAAAIEAIHAYSLIHDDLPAMDDDDLRRGHPTCHIQFDEATAILAGDALQTLAFEIL
jgi:farnesyl diphosphate synthase